MRFCFSLSKQPSQIAWFTWGVVTDTDTDNNTDTDTDTDTNTNTDTDADIDTDTDTDIMLTLSNWFIRSTSRAKSL